MSSRELNIWRPGEPKPDMDHLDAGTKQLWIDTVRDLWGDEAAREVILMFDPGENDN